MPATRSTTKTKPRSQAKPQSSRSTDYGIFAELKKDHKEIEGFFRKLEKGQDRSAFSRLGEELSLHQSAEEKAFYSPLRSEEAVREDILKGYEEHHAVNMELHELESGVSDDEHFKAKIGVLMEMVRHHIDEEENTLFPRAKKLVDKERAEQMLQEFEQHKK